MNHGGLGFLELQDLPSNASLSFPPELLEHLFVRRDGILYGIYYSPRPMPDYQDIQVKHDLMLTPIPFRFRPRAARLTLRIRHRPGMIRKLSRFLAKNHTSILQSESTRSGYRYETYSFYIVFEELGADLEYDPTKSVYSTTFTRLKKLHDDLLTDCSDVLFVEKADLDLQEPVVAMHNTALAYFHNYVVEAQKDRYNGWRHAPFELKCTGSGTLTSVDGALWGILKNAESTHREMIAPTVVFAGLDTRYLNIRTAIIPQHLLPRFLEVVVEYTRYGQPDTCLGLIASVTELFPREYNIWSSYNRTFQSTPEHEKGRIVFIIEDRDDSYDEPEQAVERAMSFLGDLNQRKLFDDGRGIRFGVPLVRSITTNRVRRRTEQQIKERGTCDVFISGCSKDRGAIQEIERNLQKESLRYFSSYKELQSGDTWEETIRQAIKDSKEVCVLCTENSLTSTWVIAECGAAWALNKRIVPVLHGVPKDSLPTQLLKAQAVGFDELEEYAKQVKMRVDGSLMG